MAWQTKVILVIACTVVAASSPADDREQKFEGLLNKLLAPGPLMTGHEDLEHSGCLKCHETGSGVPDQNCLKCHKNIQAAVAGQKGWHGHMEAKRCADCHPDHKGRDTNSTFVDPQSFHHQETGFALDGAHEQTPCARCHSSTRKERRTRKGDIRYFGLSPSCRSCHAKDSIHKGSQKLGQGECSECHNTHSFKSDKPFDHSMETGYPLLGHHLTLACKDCHETKEHKPQYSWPDLGKKRCLACHKDQHGDKLSVPFRGPRCDACHGSDHWQIASFNHDLTSFALAGKHASLACERCHRQPSTATAKNAAAFRWNSLQPSCVSCHKGPHSRSFLQKNSSRCDKCHSTQSWQNVNTSPSAAGFSHEKTRFSLTGRHVSATCGQCHLKNGREVYQFPELTAKSCQLCHVSPHDAAFRQRFGQKCDACHSTQSFKEAKLPVGVAPGSFSHDKTRFPLTGKHLAAACKQCHVQNGKESYKFPDLPEKSCLLCHKSAHNDAFHKNFGTQCASCHNTNSWQDATMPAKMAVKSAFNHDKTRFPLTGKHLAADCKQCHLKNGKDIFKFPDLPAKSCLLCHKSSHNAAFHQKFGATCTLCHNTESWQDAKMAATPTARAAFSHDKTRFPLTGHHKAMTCESCHLKNGKNVYHFTQERGEFCQSCHANVHREQFRAYFAEKPCTECHTTETFDRRKPINHDKTGFALTGAHQKIAAECTRCHVKTKQLLATMPPRPASRFVFSADPARRCSQCHTNEHVDMFHRKFYSQSCQNCHTAEAFAVPKHFDHGATAFALKGKHMHLACNACHKKSERHYHTHPQSSKGQYIFKGLAAKQCAVCHKDPHKGANGPQCSECHNEESFKHGTKEGSTPIDKKNFHKDFTLTGVHLTLRCEECHGKSQEILKGTSDKCFVCHHHEDPHRAALPNCEDCHTQVGWSFTTFDHSMTSFPLKGAHRVASCEDCHRGGVYEGLPTGCADCHFKAAQRVVNPNHANGAFQNCEQCHNEFAF